MLKNGDMTDSRDVIIRVENLKKSFGRVEAVKGISFQVKKGE